MSTNHETVRHYHLALTDSERALMVDAVRVFSTARLIDGVQISSSEIANRLERARGEEDTLDLATSMLRPWYCTRVRDLAEDVLRAVLAGEVDDLHDYLHETVDGTDLVTYTFKAKCVLLASDNEDAMRDELGESGTAEQMAYFAIRADVLESMRAHIDHPDEGGAFGTLPLPGGFDLDDSDTWAGTADEDAGTDSQDAAPATEGGVQ